MNFVFVLLLMMVCTYVCIPLKHVCPIYLILSLTQAQKRKHQPKQTSLAPTAPAKDSDVISPSPPTPAPASSVPLNAAGHNIGSENTSMFGMQNVSFPSVSMGSMSGSNSITNMKTYMRQFAFQGMRICRECTWKCVSWWLIPILLCLCFSVKAFQVPLNTFLCYIFFL